MKVNLFRNKIIQFVVGLSFILLITGIIVGQDGNAVLDNQLDTTQIVNLENDTINASTQQIEEINPVDIPQQQIQSKGFSLTSLLRGMLGLIAVLGIAFLLSSNRKKVSGSTVFGGLAIQIIIAILVLKVPAIQSVFEFVGKMFIMILKFTEDGSVFLFGDLIYQDTVGFMFAFQILPTIIFFSALSSVLYYYGIVQGVVKVFAWIMTRLLKLSGAESLSATGNIFLGQTESPLLIKAYLEKMTKSEIMVVMVSGMATIAGGVLAIYIKFLGGSNPAEQILFAKHLITASVMAAPGAVVLAKLLVPQTEEVSTKVKISKDKIGTNILEAITNGTTDGVKLAVNVGAMLLAFLAFISMLNFIFFKIGSWTDINDTIAAFTNGRFDSFSLQFILGYTMAPLMWLIGVPVADVTLVGQLLGEKIILNEFIAYTSFKDLMTAGVFASEKSIIIATYILCGFANFSSIGIQLGGIGALAPGKRTLLSKLGFRALLGGALASLLSATIVGMILG
ncbi:MAG: Na+ dependent nucleoside transporter [Bacteroidetes bacterium]|nr:Na+ dependent nucleoside transporter [Bacteroidota bacterium]